jgi:hypothetical protein
MNEVIPVEFVYYESSLKRSIMKILNDLNFRFADIITHLYAIGLN